MNRCRPSARQGRRVGSYVAAAAAAVLIVASCGTSDDVSRSTDPVVTDPLAASAVATPTLVTDVATTDPAEDEDITIEVTASESAVWMTTDADGVCSPAEPAVSVLEAVTTGDVGAVRARFEVEGGATKNADFALDDDGIWRFVFGPHEAKRTSTDTALGVTVVALPVDAVLGADDTAPDDQLSGAASGDLLDATLDVEETGSGASAGFVVPDGAAVALFDLEMLAPERCGNGTPDRRKPAKSVTLAAQADVSLIVAKGASDCAARPTTLKIGASTSGPIVAVDVSTTLPSGATVSKSLTGGPRRWQTNVGPIPGTATMPTSVGFDLVVRAVDARGGVHTDTVQATLARPEPCDTDDTGDTDDAGRTPGDSVPADSGAGNATTFAVTTSPSPLGLWATASGRCPAGPTTARIEVTVPDGVTAVGMQVRVGSSTTRPALTSSGSRTWSGTIGPFTATSGMPASGPIDVRITASGGGRERTTSVTGTVRRPDACGSTATTQPSTATTVANTSPTTTRPSTGPGSSTSTSTTTTSTTTTSTTTTTTTTTTVPAPPPLAVRASATAPVWAVADGFCGAGSTTLTIQAQTTGSPTQVGAQVSLANGASQNVQLSGGGGNWSATVGPFPASAGMPDSSGISITVIARDGNGQQASASASSTLRRPGPC